MDMVERVARAINGDMWDGFDDYCRKLEYTPEQIEKAKGAIAPKVSLNRARAAIEAIRDNPTDSMVEAFRTGAFEFREGGFWTPQKAVSHILDAALNEPVESR